MTQSEETNPVAHEKPDGRLLRSERSRQLIIEAIIELVDEGFLIPTAQQVAERAGVGIRSVFRHFDDMDSIFETANEIILKDTRPLFEGGDRSGDLDTRVLHAIDKLTAGYRCHRATHYRICINKKFLSVRESPHVEYPNSTKKLSP